MKADGVVYIKPSGVPLATLEAEDLVPLEMAPLLDLLHGRAGADAEARLEGQPDPVMRMAARARLAEARGRRPSVELLFHSLLPERFVLHTHPIVPNSVTCNRDGEAIAARIFGDEALWVPYTDPGLPLARAIRELRAAFEARTGRPAPRVTLMGNHGIIVTGDTIDEVAERCQFVMSTVRAELSRTGIMVDGPGRPPPACRRRPGCGRRARGHHRAVAARPARRRGTAQGRDLRPGRPGGRLPRVDSRQRPP